MWGRRRAKLPRRRRLCWKPLRLPRINTEPQPEPETAEARRDRLAAEEAAREAERERLFQVRDTYEAWPV